MVQVLKNFLKAICLNLRFRQFSVSLIVQVLKNFYY